MTTIKLCEYLANENEAEQYLIQSGVLRQFDNCPICGSSHLGKVRRGKYKCYGCNTEWNLRKGSFLERKKITLGEFIGVLKFFSDGMNASICAVELEMNPKFTRELYTELRAILLGTEALSNNISTTSLYFQVSNEEIKIVPGSKTDSKASIKLIRSKNENGVYYYKLDYKNTNQKSLLKVIDRIDGLDLFYRYCQERLLNFRGRNVKTMVDLLQELAFRYNHRGEDFFKILINKITF